MTEDVLTALLSSIIYVIFYTIFQYDYFKMSFLFFQCWTLSIDLYLRFASVLNQLLSRCRAIWSNTGRYAFLQGSVTRRNGFPKISAQKHWGILFRIWNDMSLKWWSVIFWEKQTLLWKGYRQECVWGHREQQQFSSVRSSLHWACWSQRNKNSCFMIYAVRSFCVLCPLQTALCLFSKKSAP